MLSVTVLASLAGCGSGVFRAAAENSVEVLVRLLDARPGLAGARDRRGETALHRAARHGRVEAAKLLLERGAEVNAWVDYGSTPLHLAAAGGHADVAKLLLSEGADVDGLTESVRLRERLLESILAAGAEVDPGEPADEGPDDATLLPSEGADVDGLTESATRPWESKLAAAGVGPGEFYACPRWESPLLLGVLGGHTEVVKLLVESKADLDRPGMFAPLAAAVADGNMVLAEVLLAAGAEVNVNPFYEDGKMSMLAFAAMHGTLVCDLPTSHRRYGVCVRGPPLHWAVFLGRRRMAELLLEHGADVNALGRYGDPALQYAASQGHREVAALLLDGGADVNARPGWSKTALCWAADRGHEDIARLLIDRGADVNLADRGSDTALHAAAERGRVSVVRLLLARGAAPEAKDSSGSTPLDLARAHGHEKVQRLLREAAADSSAAKGM